MGYGKEIYRQALEEVAARRSRAEAYAAQAKREVYDKLPALGELDRKIAKVGVEAVRAATALSGADAVRALHREYEALRAERAELLRRAGLSDEAFAPRYTCSACSDTGECGGALCSCVREAARKILYARLSERMPLEESGFDAFSLDYYPDKPEQGVNPRAVMTQILEKCRRYAEPFDPHARSLLFLGATGLGKTHLSLAIAGRAVDQGFGVIYGSAQNFLRAIENEHFGRSDGDTMQALLDCDLLVLDDLGAEFSTPFVQSTLYNLVNTRILSARPCVASTNLSLSELEERYGARIVSRLIGHYDMMRFAGADVRQLKMLERRKA